MTMTQHAPGDPTRLPGRRFVSLFLKLAISAGLLGLMAYWVDWTAVLHAVMRAERTDLGLALLVIAPSIALSAWRWACCARASSINLPGRFYLRATYASLFVGQFLPAGIGVDAARLAYFMHGKARLSHAVRSLMLDRVIGVVSVVMLLAAGLPVIWPSLPVILRLFGLGLIAAALCGIGIVACMHRFSWVTRLGGSGKGRRLVEAALAVRASVASLHSLTAFAVSCVIYCLLILGVHLIARAIGVHVPYLSLLAIVAIAMFLSLLPVSVNGWGVRESAMVTGLAALGVGREQALAVSLLFGFANAVVTLPGAFVWHLARKKADAEDLIEE